MSGTRLGGQRTRDTNYKLYGRDYYRKLGAMGGKKGHTGGFYANRELASRVGAVGGRISRRGENKLSERERREIHKAYKELMDVHLEAKRERADVGAITVFDRKRGLVREQAA